MDNKFVKRLTIEDRKYGLRLMSPLTAPKFALKVIKIISQISQNKSLLPSIKTATSLLGMNDLKKESLDSIDTENMQIDQSKAMELALSIGGIFSDIDDEELSQVFDLAFKSDVFIEGESLKEEDVFHNHFQKYPQDYFPVAIWITLNNVKPFLKNIVVGMKQAWKSSSIHPATVEE